MNDDRRVLGLLTEVLDGFPSAVRDGLLASVLDDVRTTPQRGRWRSVSGWRRFVADPYTRLPAAASLILVVVAVVALTLLSGRGTERLTGAAAVREDVRQAVIRATLDALNRRLETLLD